MSEHLFDLLPAVYRVRDHAQGDPLRALLAVVEREVRRIEDDIGGLYDDWFIETCDEWVVPYIGDLLAARHLLPLDDPSVSQRGYVANTLGYRRRKGTVAVLEQLARDLTGWPAHAVEMFERLVTTQHVNHPRPRSTATPDLRSAFALQSASTPFEAVTHTAEMRHIDNGRGKYDIPNVGLFLWRVQSYPLTGVSAAQVDTKRFAVDPLGRSTALFSVPETEVDLTHLADPSNVPLPISRRTLQHDLARLYGDADDPASLVISVDGTVRDRSTIVVCDLSDEGGGWAHEAPPGKVAVDPELGRVAFADAPAGEVTASYAYGLGGDLGGGPYDKREALAPFLAGGITWQVGVMAEPPATATAIKPTLVDAVKEWNQQPAGTRGLIVLMESRTLEEDLKTQATRINVPEGSQLVIAAGGWPEEETDDPSNPRARLTGRLTPRSVRPHLKGTIEVVGTAPAGSPEPGTLVLNGVLVEGTLTVRAGHLGRLHVSHCTLVPQTTTFTCESNPEAALTFERSIVGKLAPGAAAPSLSLAACIVDGDLDARDLSVDSTTVFGLASAQTLHATSSIFVGEVTVVRRQVGCVRFTYLPVSSSAPRRFRCQPTDDVAAATVFPTFEALAFGDPGYAMLAPTCPREITEGAEGEGEMGAWRFLQTPRRLKNLRLALDEYLRFGLEAGIFFAPQRPADKSAP
jgi:hypothetical protein